MASEAADGAERFAPILEPGCDVVVWGAGSSASVIARRLAEKPDVKVSRSEAGGLDEVPAATEASQRSSNVGRQDVSKLGLPDNTWVLFGSQSHPKSRGRVRLSSPHPAAPILIEAKALSRPGNLKTAISRVETLREIGNSAELGPYARRDDMPGDFTGAELETYLRNAVTTHWHEPKTAKMGRDHMSAVDGHLNVYGIDNLRISDASTSVPRNTSANTMAPRVVIGEPAAQYIKAPQRL